MANSAGTEPVPVSGSRGGLPKGGGVVVRGGAPTGGPAAGELAVGALAVDEAPGDVPGGVAGKVPGGVAGNVPGGVAGGVAGNVPGGVPGNVPVGVAGGVTGKVAGGVAGEVAGNVPGGLVAAAHNGVVMSLSSSVTAPLRASARPTRSAPVFMVIEASAMTLPTRSLFVPSVAELVTCQNTLHGEAPLMKTTLLFDAVINVEEIWKTNTAAGSFCESSVSAPVN